MLTEEKELGSDREAVKCCIFRTGSGEDVGSSLCRGVLGLSSEPEDKQDLVMCSGMKSFPSK